MGSQVKLLLLAAESGEQLAHELSQAGIKKYPASNGGIPTALLEVGGVPVINHWLVAARATPRLLPIVEKVFIVTSHTHYPAFVAWARNTHNLHCGFPVENIIDNGVSSPDSTGAVFNIAAYLQVTGHTDEHLLVGEADAVFEPSFSLQRIVEHSLVRAKDTLAYVVAPPHEPLALHTLVALEDRTATMPRVTAMETSPPVGACADGREDNLLAFYQYFSQETKANKGTAAQALADAADMAMANRADPVLMSLMASASPTKQLYLKFRSTYQADQQIWLAGEHGTLSATLPDRFVDATSRRHTPRVQHPVYETTSNMYGLKAPSQIEMPDVYAGTTQTFTKTFAGGMVTDGSLTTSLTKSKVHRGLDEY